jgi:hypothetical protein
MKRAKKHALPQAPQSARSPQAPQAPKPRNPVARSPLLGKGGPHGKSTGAKRRAAKMALGRMDRDEDPAP